ncbi:hypothetical protein D9758_013356 [Tetrapyrgos nigripes]|uniref:Terpenoid synthase n=1 Tax=Tetrapyrgos nigripes TaxID=182062 RepID=A0A8H5CL70_9AGAR|nr:hypothetical protein D9758_013356 [Tetrapyrgos nigripes]
MVQNSSGIADTATLRHIITSFLQQCDFADLSQKPADQDLEKLCCLEAAHRGYPLAGEESFQPFISGGLPMAANGYLHLKGTNIPTLIALYTAFLIYLDDVLCNDIEAVAEFNERLMAGKSQKNCMLDHFAALLSEFSAHFPRIVHNIMLSSTMNFVTALLLEKETQGMPMQLGNLGYPTFARALSGASEVFALAVFPSNIPVTTYIQALPELVVFINNGNDILSFYKEECDAESVNRVSQMAQCLGISKHKVLQRLLDEAVSAHQLILRTLSGSKQALHAYESFYHGYLKFYLVLERYRLAELNLFT